MSQSARWRASLLILLSGFGFGFLGIFGKLAFRSGISIGTLLTARFLLASFLLMVGLAVFRPTLLKIRTHQLVICAGLGILGYAIFASFYFAALKGLSVPLAALLLYTFPVMVAVGGRIFLHEHLTPRQIGSIPVAVLGLLLLLWGETKADSLIMILLGIAAAGSYAAYILASRKWQREINAFTSGVYVMLFAALGLFVIHRPSLSEFINLDLEQWSYILGLAVVCTIIPLVSFLSGLQVLQSSEAAVLSTVEPIVAWIAAWLILGEGMKLEQALGGLFVLVSMFLVVWRPTPKTKVSV